MMKKFRKFLVSFLATILFMLLSLYMVFLLLNTFLNKNFVYEDFPKILYDDFTNIASEMLLEKSDDLNKNFNKQQLITSLENEINYNDFMETYSDFIDELISDSDTVVLDITPYKEKLHMVVVNLMSEHILTLPDCQINNSKADLLNACKPIFINNENIKSFVETKINIQEYMFEIPDNFEINKQNYIQNIAILDVINLYNMVFTNLLYIILFIVGLMLLLCMDMIYFFFKNLFFVFLILFINQFINLFLSKLAFSKLEFDVGGRLNEFKLNLHRFSVVNIFYDKLYHFQLNVVLICAVLAIISLLLYIIFKKSKDIYI